MAKRGIENDFCCDIDLADTFIGQIHNAEVNKSLDNSPSEFQMDYGTDNIQLLSDHSRDTSLNDKGHDKLSRSQFIDEQHRDSEISCLFGKAVIENEVSQVPVCCFKNGNLLRKWRPPDVFADAEMVCHFVLNCNFFIVPSNGNS